MGTRMTVIDGRGFDGGVVDAVPAAPGEPQKRELVDERMAALTSLFMDHLEDDSEDRLLCERILAKRITANKEADGFIEKLRAPLRQKLIDAHESVKAEARAQQAKIDELRAEIARWEGELNVRNGKKAVAMTALRAADQARKNLSQFVSRAEVKAADKAIVDARSRVDRAEAHEAEAQRQLNHLKLVEFQPLLTELDKIAAREMELRAAITGESFTNALGIVVPARPPIA